MKTVLLLGLVYTHALLAQSGDEMPVPGEWLHDGRLMVSEFNFSINSLEARWLYRRLPDVRGHSATQFAAEVSGESYLLIVLEEGGRMDAQQTKSFVEGMQRSLPQGWKAGDVLMEPTNTPVPDSIKFRATLHVPGDETVYNYGYVVSGKRIFMLLIYSRASMEPPEFTRFASSFNLLTPSAQELPFVFSQDAIRLISDVTGLLMGFGAFAAVSDWKYMKKGGVKATKVDRKRFLIAMCLAAVVVVVSGFQTGIRAIPAFTILAISFLIAFWELDRWRIRRSHPLPSLTNVTPPPV